VTPSRHVVLVGLMGAGKSSVGRLLAQALGQRFADTDELVVASQGASVAELFQVMGEQGFRALELAALADELHGTEPGVVATGGGVVTTEEGRALLRGHHPVILLDVSPEVAASRIGDGRSRPLLAGEPVARLRALAEERRAAYLEVADHVVEVDRRTPGQVVGALLELLGEAA
jgi:shikimate kinase